MKMPKTIGAAIDQLYLLRQQRLALQRQAEEVQARETDLREHVLRSFERADLEGARGSVAGCSVLSKTVPRVTDWDALYAHVKRTGHFDLLQRRVSTSAYAERLAAEQRVPGVEPFHVLELSLNKISGGGRRR